MATIIPLGVSLPIHSSSQPENLGGPPSNTLLFDLAPSGVYLAGPVIRAAGALLPHPFTLTASPKRDPDVVHQRDGRHCRTRTWLSTLCCTFHRVTPPGCYPASCPMVLGLSSPPKRRNHPAHLFKHIDIAHRMRNYTGVPSSFHTVMRPQFSQRITRLIRLASTRSWGESWRKHPPQEPFLISTTATPPLTNLRMRL